MAVPYFIWFTITSTFSISETASLCFILRRSLSYSFLIMSVIIAPISHNRYHYDIYDGHYRIRHDRVTYDNHRRRDFQVNVRPPKKDNHVLPRLRHGRAEDREGIITISTRSVLHAVNIIPVLIKTVVKTGVPSLRKEIQRKRIKGMTRIRINPEEEVQHTLAQCNLMAMI